jgi:hypothetical protein
MKPADLRAIRDRLASGEPAPESDAVTPPGTAFKWPVGNVFYRFDATQVGNGTITAAKMQQFRDGVAEWAAFANLQFTEFTGTPPANYITVRENPSLGGGFSSVVGMGGGQQFLEFGPFSWNRGTVCHEVGHALGFHHEHQRADRDSFVEILFDNIHPDDQPNFVIIPGGSVNQGAYDFLSVMHYARDTLSLNPNDPDPDLRDTIRPLPAFAGFIDIMGRVFDRTLSKLDRAGMAAVYGNPSPLPSAVVTNTKDSGRGSLRSAVYFAFDRSTDAPPVPTTVSFQIPMSDPGFAGNVFTIRPTYRMVAPGAGTTIDGATQTALGNTNVNGPEIVLSGSLLGSQSEFAAGFTLRETNCVVRGLVINGFNQWGVLLFGPATAGNTVSGCYIGSDPSGATAVPNTFPGVEISNGANGNTIGGTTAAARNVISGNAHFGVSIREAGTNNNVVLGNYIGTTATGAAALGNAFAGVAVLAGAQNNIIGGAASGARNVLSGNGGEGVVFAESGTNGNSVLGSFIGTNASGTAAIANGFSGVAVYNGPQSSSVGGGTAGAGNLISGNTFQGVVIADANTALTLVQGNTIGLNLGQTAALPNGNAGISIYLGANGNTVGGLTAAARNLISGNTFQGLTIDGVGTNQNLVQGNYIGVNGTGTSAIANGGAGISIYGGAQSNTVGGLLPGARNIISGNAQAGMTISDPGTSLNLVQGNYIGLDSSGAAPIANGFSGIDLFFDAQNNTIGGTAAGARNVISGNAGRGLGFFDAATSGNFVRGNFIGLNAAGTGAVGNGFSGVEFFLASNNTLGGTSPGARNFISGNQQSGVLIDGSNTTGNLVQGNTIGLTPANAAVPNLAQGIALFTGARSNTIGGSAIGASNTIAGNAFEGIAMFDSVTMRNAISRNSIFANGARGIALYTSSNNSQNFPDLTSAILSTPTNPGGTTVAGNFTGSASTIEFFANPTDDEGQFFIGSLSVAGSGNFTAPLAAAVPTGTLITATATDANGNTSEFSAFPATETVTTTDSDMDGLPDNYENANMLNPGSAADAAFDSDGDGLTNLEEFKAGTNPRNAASILRITAIDRSTGVPRITFQTVAGKTYRLEYRDDFLLGDWSTLINGIFTASATSVQVVDPGAAILSTRFYRLALEP